MKLVLSDLVNDCFDGKVSFGGSKEMTDRIRRRVLSQLKNDTRRRHFAWHRALRTVALATGLAALLTMAAYALGLFRMNARMVPPNYTVHGQWIERDAQGNVIRIQDLYYPGANFVLTFDCNAEAKAIEFSPHWVPSEGHGWSYERSAWSDSTNDWYTHFGSEDANGTTGAITYQISCFYAVPGFQLVMQFESEIVEETTWDELEIMKLINHNPYWGDDNYILMFSPSDGYLIRVGGHCSMDELEQIARALQVRVTDRKVEYDPDFSIGIMNVGRG